VIRKGTGCAQQTPGLDALGADENLLDSTVQKNPGWLEIGHEAAAADSRDLSASTPFFTRLSSTGVGLSGDRTLAAVFTLLSHGNP